MYDEKGALLMIDAIINLALGALLLIAPHFTIFGLPSTNTYFYANILGAVLVGIGFALLVEWYGNPRIRGLGLSGAIAINFIGGGVVAVWLIIHPFEMPLRGYIVLWVVVVIVIGTGIAEVIIETRRRGHTS